MRREIVFVEVLTLLKLGAKVVSIKFMAHTMVSLSVRTSVQYCMIVCYCCVKPPSVATVLCVLLCVPIWYSCIRVTVSERGGAVGACRALYVPRTDSQH